MKNIILILVLIITTFALNAQEIKVHISVELDGDYKQDTIYVGLFPTIQKKVGRQSPLPEPYYYRANTNSNILLNAEPGVYLIGVSAFGYRSVKKTFFIAPENREMKIEVVLKPQIIGWGDNKIDRTEIKQVQLHGEYNGYKTSKRLNLERDGNVWILKDKPESLIKGQSYTFVVNGLLIDDLLNPNYITVNKWIRFRNIYQGSELVFDPSVYGKSRERSSFNIKGESKKQEEFTQFVNALNKLDEEWNNKGSKAFRSSKEELSLLMDSMLSNYSELEEKYPRYSQITIEKQLEILAIKPLTFNFPKGDKNDEDFKKKEKEFYLSSEFDQFFSEILSKINMLDHNSYLLSGKFASSVLSAQSIINECPELAEKHNLNKNYFDDIVENIIKNSTSEKLRCTFLFELAKKASYEDEKKAVEILEDLQQNHQYKKYIEQQNVDRLLSRLTIKLGKMAPDFSVTLLDNTNFNLKDQKGKFVFIDFWGSWCKPCLKELPHLKSLYSAVGRDKLEIIGLAQDKEESLRKCISENEINYPNALAPKELLAKFGIRSYPTSFLINPEGMIVRMNIRGEDAMNLIKYEINNYFK